MRSFESRAGGSFLRRSSSAVCLVVGAAWISAMRSRRKPAPASSGASGAVVAAAAADAAPAGAGTEGAAAAFSRDPNSERPDRGLLFAGTGGVVPSTSVWEKEKEKEKKSR